MTLPGFMPAPPQTNRRAECIDDETGGDRGWWRCTILQDDNDSGFGRRSEHDSGGAFAGDGLACGGGSAAKRCVRWGLDGQTAGGCCGAQLSSAVSIPAAGAFRNMYLTPAITTPPAWNLEFSFRPAARSEGGGGIQVSRGGVESRGGVGDGGMGGPYFWPPQRRL